MRMLSPPPSLIQSDSLQHKGTSRIRSEENKGGYFNDIGTPSSVVKSSKSGGKKLNDKMKLVIEQLTNKV